MCRATTLCCFNCLNWFNKTNLESCDICGDWKCPKCASCLCSLSPKEKKIAIAYMATYENLLKEVTSESYDFGRHQEVLSQIGVNRKRLIAARVKS